MLRFVVRRLPPRRSGSSRALDLIFVWCGRCPERRLTLFSAKRATPQSVEEFRHRYGLDRPLYVQYWAYLKTTLSGELGTSVASHRPVTTEIRDRFPGDRRARSGSDDLRTRLRAAARLLRCEALPLAVDHGSLFLSLIGISIPVFFLAIMLKVRLRSETRMASDRRRHDV